MENNTKELNDIKIDNKLTFAEYYTQYITQQNFHYDEEQYKLVCQISDIIEKIQEKKQNSNIIDFLKNKFTKSKGNIFYIYGSVGSGKSFITNLILRYFPNNDKLKIRSSFYNIINDLRLKINQAISSKNQKFDSHKIIADIIRKEFSTIHLLCIDEFHILDIADAIIIGDFLKIIFTIPDLVIVINSNRNPNDLYKHGPHKERFVPIINLINESSYVINLSTKDYRDYLRAPTKNYFLFSEDKQIQTPDDLKKLFIEHNHYKYHDQKFEMSSKTIHFLMNKNIRYKVIYLEFDELFNKPFYANNYFELINHFHLRKIFINNVPLLDGHDDLAKRFIAFIDIAYEANIMLLLSSYHPFEKLYNRGLVVFEFDRSISRIRVLCR